MKLQTHGERWDVIEAYQQEIRDDGDGGVDSSEKVL